ncbi:hypothetical protein [Negadavirga shengliensis]|uniref:Uncharacterized protein n=1 Tax=Negadavirga shengliensis TaxID=1389218 RepID=A0ABV9SWP8_9BACT
MLAFVCNRKVYESNAKSQLENWKSDLEQLTAAKEAGGNNNEDVFKCWENLSRQYDYSKSKVDELLNTPDQNWEQVKQGYEEIWSQTAPEFYKMKKRLLTDQL